MSLEPPPGKYYWPGSESHEAYTTIKPKYIPANARDTKLTRKIYPFTTLITGSESHSAEPMNQKEPCGCGVLHTKKYPI